MKPSLIASVTMTIIFSAVIVYALLSLGLQARLMPLLIAVPGAALSAFQLLSDLRQARASAAKPDKWDAQQLRILVWIMLCIPVILLLGFDLATPLLVLAFHRYVQRERALTSILSAAIAWLLIAIMLNRIFGAQLFQGFLPQLILAWLK